MPALAFNGLSVPVSVTGADSTPDVLEDAGRTVGGFMVRSRRAVVQSFKGTTIPVSATLADDLSGILTARMDHWSWDDSTYWEYSEGGIGPAAGTGGTYATTTPSPKYGTGYLEVGAGFYWTAGTTISGAWTVMLWTYESGAWHHYAKTSTSVYYKDGVAFAGPVPFVTVTGGTVRVGDTSSVATQYFDDMLVCFWVASADMVAGVYALGVAVGAPDPVVTGDLVSGWTDTRATCEPPDVQYVPHMGSTFEQYGRVVTIDIAEVNPG